MTNIKKIGLTALAGTLASFSANAGEMSVSGTAQMTISSDQSSTSATLVDNTDKFEVNSSLVFSGSGELDNGFGVSVMSNLTGGAQTVANMQLDMGDMGVLSFDSTGGALVGITASDDILPTAYEEMWTGVSGSGINGVGSTNVIGYQNSFGMFSVSAGYSQNGSSAAESASSGEGSHGSTTDISVKAEIMDGLTIQAGYAEDGAASTSTTSEDTTSIVGHVLYSTGPVSVGFRAAETNYGTAGTASRSIEAMSIAFNVNDNFAISYGVQDTEKEAISATPAVTEDVTGISAAYTVGAASVRLMHNKSSDDNNVVGADDEQTEVSLVLSF